jgi:hypothetical protein
MAHEVPTPVSGVGGLGGVSKTDDAGLGPFNHYDLLHQLEVEVGRLIQGM